MSSHCVDVECQHHVDDHDGPDGACGRGVCACPKFFSASDPVKHPSHYAPRAGVECIRISETFGFNLGNVIKYVWRADAKNGLEDLRKAEQYIRFEIERRERGE